MDTIETLIVALAGVATLALGGPRLQSLQEWSDQRCQVREPVQVAMLQATAVPLTTCTGSCPIR